MANRFAPQVLMVTARSFPDMGGIETHVYEVARRLVEAGVRVTVLTTDRTGQHPAAEEAEGVSIRRVRAFPAHRDYYFAPGLAGVIAEERWDLVHCQGIHTLVPLLAMAAARRARVPYIVTSHTGGHSSRLRNAARRAQWTALRPLLARANRIVVVSRFEATYFARILHLPSERFVVIRNGAHMPPLPDTAPVASTAPYIVSLGRLERYKGHHRVIAAMPALLASHPDLHLHVVGSGPYERHLRTFARARGVSDCVTIKAVPPNDRSAMASLLSGASLVTLLSDYEAHPVAVMEALALRRPVLVADTSGLRELADDGLVTAIPLQSAPATVAAAIRDQLANPHVPAAFELPTWDDCAEALLNVYHDVLR